ncbi:MAG TPA: ECF-type sigma factor [Gemmatimonadales bacterium]|jgi:RNA polymerase sigma factor (TIGR02999 family)|nr:ECF-type sigma factor [Gemmatimonadales bacterium]
MPSISELVTAADRGDNAAATELFAALYNELHTLAESHLHRQGGRVSLGTTTLVHEAYLKLSARDSGSGLRFPDRHRFLAYASKAMRGLVIDYARARRAQKRGGSLEITLIGDKDVPAPQTTDESLEQLADALERLGELDPELAQLVDLHFFGGFSFVEIAGLQGASERTVQREWRKANALLQRLVTDA